MKKTWNFFVVTLLVISVSSVVPLGASEAGSLQSNGELNFSGNGQGTEDDPYQISNWTHLNATRGDLGANYTLINDLDETTDGYETFVNTIEGWEPLGGWDSSEGYTYFTGSFDGQHYNISDLFINRPSEDHIGLFGYVGKSENEGAITNVTLKNIDITGDSLTGGLVGELNYGSVSNSSSSGTVVGGYIVGGLVGTTRGTIIKSFASVDVVSDSSETSSEAGGLAGANHGTISDCYATGDVTGNKERLGGLVGNNGATITNSYSVGKVNGDSSYVGGLIGYDYGTVMNSYWDIFTSNQFFSAAGTDLPTAEMTGDASKENMTGFDFTNTWDVLDNGTWVSYPYLRNNTQSSEPGLQESSNVRDLNENGNGSAMDPYQIKNWYHLEDINANLSANYTLMNELNETTEGYHDVAGELANDGKGFNPIALSGYPHFTGFLEGNGYDIRDLYINRPSENYLGLFEYVGEEGLVTNVSLEDVNITGGSYIGAMAGWSEGTVIDSWSSGDIIGEGTDDVGGLIGGSEGIIERCYSTANVTAHSYVGALVGGIYSNPETAFINESYAMGTVISDTDYAGGLVGYNYAGAINDCYATGDVEGSSYVGGLVGEVTDNYNDVNGTVNNSYAAGDVSGNTNVGGLVGASICDVTGSYWDMETTGQSTSAGNATGLTTVEMKGIPAKENMTYFDFINTWDVLEGYWISYPYLQNNAQTPPPGLQLSYAGGNGSADNPYLIENWTHLHDVRQDLNANYSLINDLDETTDGYETFVNTTGGFEPIGDWSDRFTGSFDGNNYTISGLYINRSVEEYVGLFGHTGTGALVKNIGLVGNDITGGDFTGSLAGVAYQSTLSNSYSTGDVNGTSRVGGLLGFHDGGLLTRSYSTADVTGITGNEDSRVGGAVGDIMGNGLVEQCYAAGTVNGGDYVGGFVGRTYDAVIRDSYATGTVNGNGHVGGFVGIHQTDASDIIERCYSTGEVTGLTRVGGFCGRNLANISNSFWDNETSGQQTSSGGTGKNTTAMKSVSTFTNITTEGLDAPWDFIDDPYDDTNNSDIWAIDNYEHINDGYPYFTWEDTSVLTINPTENGTVIDPGEGNFEYYPGETIEIEAVADENCHFVEWTGDNGTIADTTSNKTTITVEEDYSITANFEIDQHDLTTSSTEGGSVTDPGETTNTYDYGTEVTIEATPDENCHFVEWTGDNGTIADTSSNKTTITMNGDYSITAEFEIDQHDLTTASTEGGSVTDPGEGTNTYDYGEDVTIEATSEEGYHFVEWTGDTETIEDTTSETTTIEVLGDYSITAEFEEDVVEVATYELVVEIDGNGSVTMDPDESEYDEGTDVTLNATADEGWEFVGWIGDATGGDTMVNITMDENKSITANFEEQVAEFEVTNFEAEVDGLEVTVTADVENIGNIEGSLDLIIDGEVVDTVTLGPGDTDEFEYNGEFDEDGDYDIDFGEESDTVNAEGDSLDTGEDSSNITMIVGILLIIVVILAIIGYVMKSGGEEADPAMEEEMFEEPEETEEEPIEEETIEEETGEETGEESLEEEGEFDEEVPEEESENEEM